MKSTYLILAILGFIAPNILVVIESVETGNILLYADIASTFQAMFANRISSIFSIDLFFTLLVFFIWSYKDSQQRSVSKVWRVWLLTMLFGLAGGFPYYLHLRSRSSELN